ncbi:hypothetical protein ACHAXR_004801 [Thalassiosira sp. AJA248-18]
MNRENSRRSDFKKGIDAMEGRRRRTETTISLRKNKKDEGIAKRRAMPVAPAMPTAMANEKTAMNESTSSVSVESKKIYTAADIPQLKAALSQPNITDATLLDVVRGFRKILSVEQDPPVNEVLASGVLPAFVQMLQLNDKPQVQFEAAWALTNVASTDETKAIVDAGAVPFMVQLLSSPSAEVREQCAWCLGNIAGDSAALRDIVLSAGAMQPLIQNIVQPDNNSLFGNCVWTLSNLCRGKPVPHLSHVAPAVPVLAQVLQGKNDAAKTDALWALSYISDGDDDRIQAVLSTGIADLLIEMLGEESGIITPALRTVGNIVSGNDDQTQAVIEAGLMSKMQSLLNHPKRMIRKEACWVLSNVAAGTNQQISTVLRSKGCMQRVVEMAISSEWEVRKEAIWIVSNIATGGSDKQIMSVVEAGAIDAICSVLNVNDSKMLLVALDAIDCVLKLGMKLNKDYTSFVDECDGLTMIETLQEHESDEVYQKAVMIIETYFGAEDGAEDENLAPEANGNTFSFGVPQKPLDQEAECPATNGNMNAQPFTTFNFAN